MPFKPEAAVLQAQGAAALQNDHSIKDPFGRGASRSLPPGDPQFHVTATPQEVYDYCKVRDYPASTCPHGVFFLLEDGESQKILACSANTATLFGSTPSEVLGTKFSSLFSDGKKLDTVLSSGNLLAANPITLPTAKGPTEGDIAPLVNVILQRSPNGITADVEELDPCEDFLAVNDSARAAVGMLDTCGNVQELCQQVVWDTFNILGCDRVLILHSHEDGVMEILSERRSKRVNNPFLGQTWPATDLDPTSRLGFLTRTYSRMVVDASADGVEVVTIGDHIKPEEISLKSSLLRSIHKCLAEQMAVWGSKAMASFALVAQGRLWGLLCAHHCSSKSYSFQTRMAVELLTQGFNLRLSKLLDTATLSSQESMMKLTSLLCNRARERSGEEVVKSFFDGNATIANVVDGCRAAALCHKGQWTTVGELPGPEVLNKLAEACQTKWPGATAPQGITKLSGDVEAFGAFAAKAAGALYIPLPGVSGSCLFVFRPEMNKPTVWSGDPSMASVKDRATGIVYPRKNYSDFPVKNSGKCTDWVQVDVDAATAIGRALSSVLQDKLLPATELSAVTFPAFSVDGAGTVTVWNDAVAAMTGVPASEAVGQPAASLVVPKSQGAMQGMLVQAIQGVMSVAGELVLKVKGAVSLEDQAFLGVRSVPASAGGPGVTVLGLDRRGAAQAETKYKKLSAALSQIDKAGASLRPNNMVVNVQATEDNFEYFPDKDDGAEALIVEDKVSKTHLMVNRKDGALYEVRKINLKKAEKAGASLNAIKREVMSLLRLRHDGLVRYRACFATGENKNLCVVADFEGEKLAGLLEGNPSGMPEATCRSVAKQLLQTLADLHAKSIAHGNVSTHSVVVLDDGTVKLGDFGLRSLLKGDAPTDKDDVLAAGKVLIAALGEGGKDSGLARTLAALQATPDTRPSAAAAVAML